MKRYAFLLLLAIAVAATAQNENGIPPQAIRPDATIRKVATFNDVLNLPGLRDGERLQIGEDPDIWVLDLASVVNEDKTANGPGTILNAYSGATPGRWMRQYEGPVDPAFWGASPSASAAVNDLAIQTAIDTKKPVECQDGSFDISTTLLFDGNITFRGKGRNTTTFVWTGAANGTMMAFSSADSGLAETSTRHCDVSGFELDGSETAGIGFQLGDGDTSFASVGGKITDVRANRLNGPGYALDASQIFTLARCEAEFCNPGFVSKLYGTAQPSTNTTTVFDQCRAINNVGIGFEIRQFSTFEFRGCVSEANTREGVVLANDNNAASTVMMWYGLHLEKNNKGRVPTASTFDNTTDFWTQQDHGLADGETVTLTTAGTLPAGFATSTTYFLVNATRDTFQLSTTEGGAPIDGTDNGTGSHTYNPFGDFGQLVVQQGTSSSILSKTEFHGLNVIVPVDDSHHNIILRRGNVRFVNPQITGATVSEIYCPFNTTTARYQIVTDESTVDSNYITFAGDAPHVTIHQRKYSGNTSTENVYANVGGSISLVSEFDIEESKYAVSIVDAQTVDSEKYVAVIASVDASDLTPDVSDTSTLRITAAGTFTDFTGDVEGQHLDVVTTIAGVIVDDNSGVQLDGNVDWTSGTNGGVLPLINIGGTWYQRGGSTVID